MEKELFTSESVSEGHPDKIADQISDGILDAMLRKDPQSRVACETLVSTGMVIISGEVTTKTYVNIPEIARAIIRDIGYTSSEIGFDSDSCAVLVSLKRQSPDISQGVTRGKGLFKEQGAGDQGMMFGYACDETPELMPVPIALAHRLVRQLAVLRKTGKLRYLRPDSKSQVTVEYVDGRPKRVDGVVISTQHAPWVSHRTIRRDLINRLIKPVCGKYLDAKTKYFINPTGRFVIGGPHGDCGLTGRKIIVDTYGGMGRHGGGAFSGKDPSKVDRSAAYMARYIAKNLVAAGAARKCEIQLAYAIGVAEPVSVLVNTFGTSRFSEEALVRIVRKVFPLKPAEIIARLRLKHVRYRDTAAYGHFGRRGASFTWEKTDRAAAIRKRLEKE